MILLTILILPVQEQGISFHVFCVTFNFFHQHLIVLMNFVLVGNYLWISLSLTRLGFKLHWNRFIIGITLLCNEMKTKFDPLVGKIPWRRKWHPTPVLLPGKSHGRRSLVGYSPWGHKELDTTERLHFLVLLVLLLWSDLLWSSLNAFRGQIGSPL